jgi:hypothetical protein
MSQSALEKLAIGKAMTEFVFEESEIAQSAQWIGVSRRM